MIRWINGILIGFKPQPFLEFNKHFAEPIENLFYLNINHVKIKMYFISLFYLFFFFLDGKNKKKWNYSCLIGLPISGSTVDFGQFLGILKPIFLAYDPKYFCTLFVAKISLALLAIEYCMWKIHALGEKNDAENIIKRPRRADATGVIKSTIIVWNTIFFIRTRTIKH